MTGPLGNSAFCFPRISKTLRFEDQSLSVKCLLFSAALFDVCYKVNCLISGFQRGLCPICESLKPNSIYFSPESFSSHTRV